MRLFGRALQWINFQGTKIEDLSRESILTSTCTRGTRTRPAAVLLMAVGKDARAAGATRMASLLASRAIELQPLSYLTFMEKIWPLAPCSIGTLISIGIYKIVSLVVPNKNSIIVVSFILT